MEPAGRSVAVSPQSHSVPTQPIPADQLPVTAERHAALRAQIASEAEALGEASQRGAVIDRALQYGYVNRLGMPTVKRILGEFGVAAAEVERVAGTRAQNPYGGHDRLDRQSGLDGAARRHALGGSAEPVTRRLPFA